MIELQLNKCYPSTADTLRIITACSSLWTLAVRWDNRRPDVDGEGAEAPTEIDLQIVLAALRKHEKTLEKLTLTNLRDDGQFFSPNAGTLSPLVALHKLEVDEDVLIGWTKWAQKALALPPNLADLIVHKNDRLQDGTINDVFLAISKCSIQKFGELCHLLQLCRVHQP